MNINNRGKDRNKVHYFSKYLNLFLDIYLPHFDSYMIKKRLHISLTQIKKFPIVLPINNNLIESQLYSNKS